MRSPRQWWKEETRDLTPLIAGFLAASGWVGDDPTARAIYTVAALAILRGKL